jgi:hypothetical protein
VLIAPAAAVVNPAAGGGEARLGGDASAGI